jgi:hypothetical protein
MDRGLGTLARLSRARRCSDATPLFRMPRARHALGLLPDPVSRGARVAAQDILGRGSCPALCRTARALGGEMGPAGLSEKLVLAEGFLTHGRWAHLDQPVP